MLWLGIVLLIVGAIVAALLPAARAIGYVVAVIGLVLIFVALLFVADANAVMALFQR